MPSYLLRRQESTSTWKLTPTKTPLMRKKLVNSCCKNERKSCANISWKRNDRLLKSLHTTTYMIGNCWRLLNCSANVNILIASFRHFLKQTIMQELRNYLDFSFFIKFQAPIYSLILIYSNIVLCIIVCMTVRSLRDSALVFTV